MAGRPAKEQNAREVYADIIDLPHWQSPTRPHMSPADRAAQFSPFAALTGFSDMVEEEARSYASGCEPDFPCGDTREESSGD